MSQKSISKLELNNSFVLVIDYQSKLFPLIFNNEEVLDKAETLLEFANLVKLPVVLTEHYPKGLGSTVEELKNILEAGDNYRPLEKSSFDCFRDEKIASNLASSKRKNVLVCGIETHICVLQTLLSALKRDFNVFLLVDAVGSRDQLDHHFALMQAENAGAVLTTVETVMYQMVKGADFPKFKDFIKLVTSRE